jgi:hypothetical protein
MPTPQLDREEYIEQAYFFRVYRERLEENVPSQEILQTIYEEVLATTKLPMAIEFLKGEILLTGRISDGMTRLAHYFRPFQAFVMAQAEEDKSRFDQKIALQILEREAEYLAGSPLPAALFVYQFECIARNRLGYDRGMTVMSQDPLYDEHWQKWILKSRLRLGTTDFADLVYHRSEHYVEERRRRTGHPEYRPSQPILFGVQEGRIAKANRGKDPLYMFAALQRQLGYPAVPRAQRRSAGPDIHPALEARLQRMEKRMKLLEAEVKEEFDLSQFYAKPPSFRADNEGPPAGRTQDG